MSIGFHIGKTSKASLTKNILMCQKEFDGMRCCQIFTYGPMNQNKNQFDEKELCEIIKTTSIYIHSSYMSSFKYWPHIIEQLQLADKLGVKGIVFHLPKDSPDNIAHFTEVMCRHFKNTRLLWEMRAMKPDNDSYESPEKLIALVNAIKSKGIKCKQVGIVIDLAHIYAGKMEITTKKEAKEYLDKLEPIKKWIALLHLNGNVYDVRDRSGDKHCCPMSKDDKIWTGMTLDKSGCKAFYDWYHKLDLDVILEIEINKESLELFYNLRDGKV
jgi:endonuclease IV